MKNYQVLWSDDAEFDLETIITYIMIDSIDTAKKIFYAIKEACQQLHYFPERKRIVPELQQIGLTHYRECIYQRWRVIFEFRGQELNPKSLNPFRSHIARGSVYRTLQSMGRSNIFEIFCMHSHENVGTSKKL